MINEMTERIGRTWMSGGNGWLAGTADDERMEME